MVKNMIRLGLLATMIVVFTGTAWSALLETQAGGENPYVLAKGGYGPGNGTGNGGYGPADGIGYGPGDCSDAGSADTMHFFARKNGGGSGGRGGHGPGNGTGNGGNGPKDGTGNGPGSC